MTYTVEKNWAGAILYWDTGSCSFPTPAAARRYAEEVEGRKLVWAREGKPVRRWTATS